MKQPLISIIIPVYNVEEYLAQSLDSILAQSIGQENIEVILVNDGSKDRSKEIMEEYCAKYSNFTAIHLEEPSGAAGKPRNVGIDKACGKYLMFLDPDDLYTPDACKVLYDTISKADSDVVTGTYEQFNSTEVIKPNIFRDRLNSKIVNIDVSEKTDLLVSPPAVWSRIFKASFIKENKIYFPHKVKGQDAVFVLESLLSSDKVTFIPTVICRYRIREKGQKSAMQNVDLRFFEDYDVTRRLIIELYEKHNKVDYREIRYLPDLRFFFNKLQELDEKDQVAALEKMQWFTHYYNNSIGQKMNAFERLATMQIQKGEFQEAIETLAYMNYKNMDPKVRQLQEEINRLKSECNRILLSRSWKITKPLRTVMHIVKGKK